MLLLLQHVVLPCSAQCSAALLCTTITQCCAQTKAQSPFIKGSNRGWEKNAQVSFLLSCAHCQDQEPNKHTQVRPSSGVPDMKESLQCQYHSMDHIWPAEEALPGFKEASPTASWPAAAPHVRADHALHRRAASSSCASVRTWPSGCSQIWLQAWVCRLASSQM